MALEINAQFNKFLQFANPATREAALAKGYHPSELGRLANAVNYYMKATGATEEMALEVEHPGYSQNAENAIGGDFEDTVRANLGAYGPQ